MVGMAKSVRGRKPSQARAEVVAENGDWSVTLTGLPIAAEGATFDEALGNAVLSLRDYATTHWHGPSACTRHPTTPITGNSYSSFNRALTIS
jgi:hypothetical protein